MACLAVMTAARAWARQSALRRCVHVAAPARSPAAAAPAGNGGGSCVGTSALALEDEIADTFRVPNEPFDVMKRSTVTLEAKTAEEAIAHVLTDSGANGELRANANEWTEGGEGGGGVMNSDDLAVQCLCHTAAATPSPLVAALPVVARERNLTNITVMHLHTEGPAPHMAAENAGRFRDRSFFTGANAREAIAAGRADYVPIFLSEVPLLFRRGRQPVDVALLTVSPADKHGFHSLGVSIDVTRAALQVAKKVVALVNPNMPRTFGDGNVHASHFDAVYHSDTPLHELPRKKEGGPAEETIGRLIADNLVRDGATLQMGIGAIPDATLRYLTHHKNLGIHSEMFSDGIIDLVQSGVVNNINKTTQTGKITGGFAIGSKRLYQFMDDNPQIVMLDIAYVNDTAVIRRQPRMTAINSCIEVDLTGQIVSDSIGTRVFSGVGGQMDFIRGASLCPDGRAIIALPSTTSKGESRIVPLIKPGAGVVTTRAHAHYVVTEHGIVDLFGKSLRQRAAALISVAHPDHRPALTAAARERGLV